MVEPARAQSSGSTGGCGLSVAGGGRHGATGIVEPPSLEATASAGRANGARVVRGGAAASAAAHEGAS